MVWEGEEQHEPQYHHSGDAGFDLVVSEPRVVYPGSFVDVPCGVAVAFPEGVWGMITGRSSTLRKRKLMVAQGIIDEGYRGPLFAGVWNLGREKTWILDGDRIAQLVLFRGVAGGVQLERGEVDQETSRGAAGFGSTGS